MTPLHAPCLCLCRMLEVTAPAAEQATGVNFAECFAKSEVAR